jgi:hypothetical protein
MMNTLMPARLGGRCADGYERGQGSKQHAVEWNGMMFIKCAALCGARPGSRSVGWCERPELPITCPRCLKKMKEERE